MQLQQDILIVDDDSAILAFMVDLLTDEGYSVHTADTASSAFAVVATAHPALILMDLGLPDMNGAEVLRQLRTTAEYTGAIVIISAHTKGGASFLLQGATAYLAKPFHLDELLLCVQQYASPLQEQVA